MSTSSERGVDETGRAERAIKVFHLIGTLERGGGTEEGMVVTIPRLDRDRFVNVVCSITDLMPLKAEYEAHGIRVHTLGARGKWDMRAVRRLVKLLRTERPDILHCYLFHGNMLGRVAGRLAGVPAIVSSERSVGHHSRAGIILNRLTSGLVTAVETNSEAGKDFVRETLGFDPGDVFVVHGGVEETSASSADRSRIRRSLGIGAQSPVVGYIGRLHQAKGVQFLIEAFASVLGTHPAAKMVVVGEGEERNRLQKLARTKGLHSGMRFLGRRSDVNAIMSALDVLVVPSLREGFPRVVLEAMMMGRPVVATRVGGVSEAVVDGVTGLLVPPREPGALSEAILRVLSDREAALEMGQKARARAQETFSLDQAAHRYSRFYTYLALGSRKQIRETVV